MKGGIFPSQGTAPSKTKNLSAYFLERGICPHQIIANWTLNSKVVHYRSPNNNSIEAGPTQKPAPGSGTESNASGRPTRRVPVHGLPASYRQRNGIASQSASDLLRAASKITVQNFLTSVMAERTSLLGIAHQRLRISKPRRGFRCYEISNNGYATANKNVH